MEHLSEFPLLKPSQPNLVIDQQVDEVVQEALADIEADAATYA